MQNQMAVNFRPSQLGEAALAASRQMWLASLGATVVARDWVQSEAGLVFKTLVKEGTVVEAHAIRFVGNRVESSLDVANTVWKQTRRTVEATVKQAATTVVDYAQQVLPKSLPRIELPAFLAPAPKPAPVKRAKKAAKKAAPRSKRTTRRTTKRRVTR